MTRTDHGRSGAEPRTGTAPERPSAEQPDPDAVVLQHLEEATARIIARGAAPADPEAAEREKETVRAGRYLLNLLSRRRRSEHELRERLAQREVPAAIAHEAIARLARAGLLDDAAFAEEWIRQRREMRGLGDEALRRELQDKGVAVDLIEDALQGGDHDEEDRCRDLVRSRLRQEHARLGDAMLDAGSPEWAGARRRLDAYLTRRGYGGDMAVRVISAEMRALIEG